MVDTQWKQYSFPFFELGSVQKVRRKVGKDLYLNSCLTVNIHTPEDTEIHGDTYESIFIWGMMLTLSPFIVSS